VVLAPLLEPLALLLTFLVALGLSLLAIQLAKALFQVADSAIGWIPWVGSRVTGSLHTIEQRITNYLGHAAVGLQHKIGASFHSLARLIEQIGETLRTHAALLLELAESLPGVGVLAQLTTLVQRALRLNHATGAKVQHVTRVVHDGARITKHVTNEITKVITRTAAIPAGIATAGDIANVRDQVRGVEDALADMWAKVRGLGGTTIAGVGVGAVAWALSRLGINAARCSNVDRLGRRVCGMDTNFLEALLAGTLLLVGTLSLVEMGEELLDLQDEWLPTLTRTFRELADVPRRTAAQQGF
jgi:hypothetical protein